MNIEIILDKKPPSGESTFLMGMNGLSIFNPLLLIGFDRLILEEISVPEPAVGMAAFGATGLFSKVFALVGRGKWRTGDFCFAIGNFLSDGT